MLLRQLQQLQTDDPLPLLPFSPPPNIEEDMSHMDTKPL